jgi:hypothetical protein
MQRKRFPCGTMEDFGQFSRRSFCSKTCGTKWTPPARKHAVPPFKVDDADRTLLESVRSVYVNNGRIYVKDANCRKVPLARMLMNAPPGLEVDHINGDPLDNRRSNLRLVSRQINQQNQRKPNLLNRCGVLGVSLHGRKYRVHGRVNGRSQTIATFPNIEDAKNFSDAWRRANYPGYTGMD